uniref:Non-specific lipid-transfer protein n=1 Tax=Chimonanthus praecox TaxID=13419 RepID=C3W335_9MAGN|nr:lipid transfer protein [Chimonanthus praecox]
MGRSMISVLAFVVMVTGALMVTPYVEAALTCGTVTSALSPCITYVRNGGSVPASCCQGVAALNSAAKTTADRQAACSCLKSALSSVSGIQPSLASSLPGKCGVSIPYQISPSTDCSKVK